MELINDVQRGSSSAERVKHSEPTALPSTDSSEIESPHSQTSRPEDDSSKLPGRLITEMDDMRLAGGDAAAAMVQDDVEHDIVRYHIITL